MDLIEAILASTESELERQVKRLDSQPALHNMVAYHMGWIGEGAGPAARGKRLRPILLLLTVSACGRDWAQARPAAAAVELVHSFSLVHDDIQDNSRLRRGRPALWTQCGTPMAINAGDALLVLAHESLLDLAEYYQPGVVLSAARLLDEGCRALSVGQFLDMSYQDKRDIGIQDYWPMVAGKTAALLATCCQLGALLGGSDDSRQDLYRSFGHYLGLAFQVQDDLLGIWGDDSLTGKSVVGDLVEGKKSLPVIVGLEKDGAFAERWRLGHISPAEAPGLAQLLARDGALEYTQDSARQMTDLALDSLRRAAPTGQAAELLGMMARGLLNRKA